MSRPTDVRPGATPTPGLGSPAGPAPVLDLRDQVLDLRDTVLDLRDRPAVRSAVPTRRARLARLQALDVQGSALLHARVTGRRRTPRPLG